MNDSDKGAFKKIILFSATYCTVIFSHPFFSPNAEGQSVEMTINRQLKEKVAVSGHSDRRLVAHYLDLAKKQKYENGKQAAASLSKALSIQRAVSGGEHPDQIPIIEELVKVQLENEEWHAGEKTLRLLKRINQNRKSFKFFRRIESNYRINIPISF